MMRFTPAAWWIGHTATERMAAVQLGVAITPLWCARSPPLTSGTTSGVFGSMRKADELSIPAQPAALAAGTNSRLRVAPAEKKAMSTPLKASAFSSSTLYGLPLNSSVLPTERAEASSFREATGKFRRSRTRRISTPTAPVAPTMAMFLAFMVARNIQKAADDENPLLRGFLMLLDRRHQARGVHQ